MPARIAIVHGNDGSDVRIGKVCRSLSAMGFDTHFIGWDTRPEAEKDIDLGAATPHIMVRATPYGRTTVVTRLQFGWHTVRMLARLRPDVACCVNEDNAFLVLPFRGVLYRYLVCDVFDALVDRHSNRGALLRCVLRIVSEITRTGADRLIATDRPRFERFGRFRRKCVVIENVPEDPGEELSRLMLTGPVKVYVSGSLSIVRGLRQIIEVAEQLDDVEIVSAGWLYDDYAQDVFARHPKVSFRGIVTARQSLELAAGCDVVLALYLPNSVNNRNASPNKIYDAISVGRPVIINSETGVSRWVAENKLGYRCPYADVDALREVISSLGRRRRELADFARHARAVYLESYTWGRMEKRLDKLYRGLCGGPHAARRISTERCRTGQ